MSHHGDVFEGTYDEIRDNLEALSQFHIDGGNRAVGSAFAAAAGLYGIASALLSVVQAIEDSGAGWRRVE